MNSGHSTPLGSFGSSSAPHVTHAEPWAHNYICCDVDHNASTSRPSTPVSRFVSALNINSNNTQRQHQHRSHPSTSSTVQSFFSALPEPACCDEPQCPDTEVECCTDPGCQEGAICEDEGCHFPHNPNAQPGDPDSAESMRELERWACSKEGCHAIQQYLECCTQDDCALPVCTDNHPAPVVCNHDGTQQNMDFSNNPFMNTDATSSGGFGAQSSHHHLQPQSQTVTNNVNMFDPSQLPPAPWPSLQHHNNGNGVAPPQQQQQQQAQQAIMPNVCHWQNCHQVFGTTPELLAHIASDHLNAPAVVPQPMVNTSTGENSGAMSMSGTMPNMLDTTSLNSQPFDLSNLQLNTNGVDPLLSCLWDDCFPTVPDTSGGNMFDMNATQPQVSSGQSLSHMALMSSVDNGNTTNNNNLSTAPVQDLHAHGHAHGHSHGTALGHSHTHSTGEPFSPQTMLRHVLEEHLGLNPGDLSWTATAPPLMPPPVPTSTPVLPPSISSAATTPVITPVHPVKPHHHHIPILPTPSPSTYAGSPPPHSHAYVKPHPHAHALVCLWPGCTACHAPFPNTASLMAHLSDEHIGKCKNTYTCLWDTCGHVGGREFKSRQKVLRHLQSHIGHKPYVCEVCDQAFSEAAPLAAHKRRHAQEKPFKCDHPGCGKTFAISSSLTIHMRTHNGEKPFVCPHCDKGFVEASNLTKHIRTHTGERPFVCSYPGCEKRFPRPDQLKRHMAIHDADRPGRGKKSRHNSIADLAALA